MFGQIRQDLSEIFHSLTNQKESIIEEGHLQRDHVRMMISIPPKNSVSQVVWYIKGKSAIAKVRNYFGRQLKQSFYVAASSASSPAA